MPFNFDHIDELKEWITWNDIASEAQELGLAPVVEAYRSGVPHEQIKPAYLLSHIMATPTDCIKKVADDLLQNEMRLFIIIYIIFIALLIVMQEGML